MPSRSSSSSYCLPAKYGGDVTTSATRAVGDGLHVAAVALLERLVDRSRREERVVAGELRGEKRS